VTLSVRLETLSLALRDPFVIARASHGRGRSVTTVIAELRDDADGPDGPVGLGEGYPDSYYGETPATIAAVVPLLLDALDPVAVALRGPLPEARAASRRRRADGGRHRASRGREMPSTSRSTTSSAGGWGYRSGG
jgi:L-alanine-DL-glutamate epimerase-like enolase superfamily enzyme